MLETYMIIKTWWPWYDILQRAHILLIFFHLWQFFFTVEVISQ